MESFCSRNQLVEMNTSLLCIGTGLSHFCAVSGVSVEVTLDKIHDGSKQQAHVLETTWKKM